jgi:hypothetical protein
LKGQDRHIRKYPEKDLLEILKESGYHSEEWEESDPEENWEIIQPARIETIREPRYPDDDDIEDEDDPELWIEKDIIIEEAVKKKTTSIYVYERWWRSRAVCIFNIYFINFYFIKYKY